MSRVCTAQRTAHILRLLESWTRKGLASILLLGCLAVIAVTYSAHLPSTPETYYLPGQNGTTIPETPLKDDTPVNFLVGFERKAVPASLIGNLTHFTELCDKHGLRIPRWHNVPRQNPAYSLPSGTDFLVVEVESEFTVQGGGLESQDQFRLQLERCVHVAKAGRFSLPKYVQIPKYVRPDYKLRVSPTSLEGLISPRQQKSTRHKERLRERATSGVGRTRALDVHNGPLEWFTDNGQDETMSSNRSIISEHSSAVCANGSNIRLRTMLNSLASPEDLNSYPHGQTSHGSSQPRGLTKEGAVLAALRSMANALWEVGVRGEGVRIAVFDSGLHPHHPHFLRPNSGSDASAIEDSIDWTTDGTVNDLVGHGTFVSSVIAGQHPSFPGMAPDAKIISMRIFTKDLVSLTSSFLDGFNYVLAAKIDIVSVSLGGTDYLDGPFTEKIAELTAAGIIVVSAIGNDGPLFGTLNNPGDHPEVLGVGGLYANFALAPFSARGMTLWELQHGGYGRVKPDILAVSRRLRSSAPIPDVPVQALQTGERIPSIPDPGYRELSGTSVACPVITGAVALLISANRRLAALERGTKTSLVDTNPTQRRALNAASLKQILIESALRLDQPQKVPTKLVLKEDYKGRDTTDPNNWYHLIPGQLEPRRPTSPDSSIFEQGAGSLDLVGAFHRMVQYTPHVSVIPNSLDMTPEGCPYLWPLCEQPLYATQIPVLVNVTVLNGLAVSSSFVKAPEWTITSVRRDPKSAAEERSQPNQIMQSAIEQYANDPELQLPVNFGQSLLKLSFSYPEQIWPYAGYLGVHFEIDAEAAEPTNPGPNDLTLAKTGPIIISGEISFTLVTHEWKQRHSSATLPFSVRVIPRPPRERRLLWDQFRSIPFPHGYAPRDDLDAGTDILDSHGDHPHTNFRALFRHLIHNRGYYLEVLNTDYTCFDAENYAALLIVDPEEEFFIEEIAKIVQDVKYRGLSIVVFADWYNEDAMHAVRFFDENTQRMWRPFTGGANLPALNSLLHPFGITFGNRIYSGRFRLGVVRPRPWHPLAEYLTSWENDYQLGLQSGVEFSPAVPPPLASPSFYASGSSLVTFPAGGFVVSMPVQDLTPHASLNSEAVSATPRRRRVGNKASTTTAPPSNQRKLHAAEDRADRLQLVGTYDDPLERPLMSQQRKPDQMPVHEYNRPVRHSGLREAIRTLHSPLVAPRTVSSQDRSIAWKLRGAQPVLGILDVSSLLSGGNETHASALPAAMAQRSELWDTRLSAAAASPYTRGHAYSKPPQRKAYRPGRIAVFGDSSCLDGSYRTAPFFWGTTGAGPGGKSGTASPAAGTALCLPLFDAMIDFAALGRRDPHLFPESARLTQPFRARNLVDPDSPQSKALDTAPIQPISRPRRLPLNDLHLHSRVLGPNSSPACYALRRAVLASNSQVPQVWSKVTDHPSWDAELLRYAGQGVVAGLVRDELEEMERFARSLSLTTVSAQSGDRHRAPRTPPSYLIRKLVGLREDQPPSQHDDGSGYPDQLAVRSVASESKEGILLRSNRFAFLVYSRAHDRKLLGESTSFLPTVGLLRPEVIERAAHRLTRLYGARGVHSVDLNVNRGFGPRRVELAAISQNSMYDPAVGFLKPVKPIQSSGGHTSIVHDSPRRNHGIFNRIRQGYGRAFVSILVVSVLSLLSILFIHYFLQASELSSYASQSQEENAKSLKSKTNKKHEYLRKPRRRNLSSDPHQQPGIGYETSRVDQDQVLHSSDPRYQRDVSMRAASGPQSPSAADADIHEMPPESDSDEMSVGGNPLLGHSRGPSGPPSESSSWSADNYDVSALDGPDSDYLDDSNDEGEAHESDGPHHNRPPPQTKRVDSGYGFGLGLFGEWERIPIFHTRDASGRSSPASTTSGRSSPAFQPTPLEMAPLVRAFGAPPGASSFGNIPSGGSTPTLESVQTPTSTAHLQNFRLVANATPPAATVHLSPYRALGSFSDAETPKSTFASIPPLYPGTVTTVSNMGAQLVDGGPQLRVKAAKPSSRPSTPPVPSFGGGGEGMRSECPHHGQHQ